jgi:SurA N-terminal domain
VLGLRARAIGVIVATAAAVVVVTVPAHADTQPDWRVALVGTQPITASLYRHWEHVAHRQAPRDSAKQRRTQVMTFLINSFWIIGEAQERGIRVSYKQVDRTLERQRRAAFPSEREFKRFLRQSGETVADLKFRVRIDLLTGKLASKIDPGAFYSKWRAQTLCAVGFSVHDCGGTLTG